MKKHYRTENNCLNCGATLQGKFCHVCGQENLQIKESFGHLMNHAISDYFHFDEQFFNTLKPLLFQPGKLTTEYMAGKRMSYLHPVKMYIFISLIFFVLLFSAGKSPVGITSHYTKKEWATMDSVIIRNSHLSAGQKREEIKKLHQYTLIKGINGKKFDTVYFNIHGFMPPTVIDTSYKQYLISQQKLPGMNRKLKIANYWEKGLNMGYQKQCFYYCPYLHYF